MTDPEQTGELLLHPTHWLYKGHNIPRCPECLKAIEPMTPVEVEELPDGLQMFRHAKCAKVNAPEPRAA